MIRSDDGLMLRAAIVGGALSITREYPGDTAVGSPIAATGPAPTGSFQIAAAAGRHWLHCMHAAESASSLWYSHDDGASWTRDSGGIATAATPRITAGVYGLIASARSGTGLWVTRRAPGDTAWATPFQAVNHTGANLSLTTNGFGISNAVEGPARLILSATMTGDVLACDHWSASEGQSWKVI